MQTYGPFYPSSVVSDGSNGGVAWSNPGNASADDASFTQSQTWLGYNVGTQFLKAVFASLDAPDGADISVTFRVKRHHAGIAIRDAAARLVLGGAIQSEDHASTSNWPASDEWAEYAFTGLTPAQVNDGGFGFALAAVNPAPNFGHIASSGTPLVNAIEVLASW